MQAICVCSHSKLFLSPWQLSIMATTVVDIPKLGKVKGKVFEKSNIRRFHIPYATVPKRWRIAKPVPAWEGELDCTQQRYCHPYKALIDVIKFN